MKRALHVRSWGMIVALPLLVVLQALAPTPVGMMILIIVAGLLLTSLIWVLNLGATLRVTRKTRRDWAHTGETMEEKFTIGNAMWLPVPWAEISSADDLPDYALRRAMAVPARGVMRWTTRIPCMRRGIYTLGPTLLRAGDPFGLLEVTLTSQDARPFYVYPPVTTAPLLADPPARLYGPRRSQPRNLAQAMDTGRWLQGARNPGGDGKVPGLRTGLADWSTNDIVYYLETGVDPDFDVVGGEMAAVQSNMSRLPDADREAMAAYLKALP